MADSIMIIMLITSVIFFGIAVNYLGGVVNSPIAKMNELIDAGQISEDTHYYFDLMIMLFKCSPLLVILGLFTFAYERAVGTNIDVKLFYSYEVMLLVGLMVSAYLVLTVGWIEDSMLTSIWTNNPFGAAGMGYEDQTNLILGLLPFMYLTCICSGVLASMLMTFFSILKQRDNIIGRSDDDGGAGPSVTPYYTMDQIGR